MLSKCNLSALYILPLIELCLFLGCAALLQAQPHHHVIFVVVFVFALFIFLGLLP